MTSSEYVPPKSEKQVELETRMETLRRHIADLAIGEGSESVDLEEHFDFASEIVGKDIKLHGEAAELLSLIRQAVEIKARRDQIVADLEHSDKAETE